LFCCADVSRVGCCDAPSEPGGGGCCAAATRLHPKQTIAANHRGERTSEPRQARRGGAPRASKQTCISFY